MASLAHILVVSTFVIQFVWCLDNGLARTPPMGWMAWERFRCNVDCDMDPANCVGERLFVEHANVLAKEGYLKAGYDRVNIDDCWLEKQRDADGNLVANKKNFPHGIKYLADYVHGLGLKLGIYEDYGNFTCCKYPGSKYHTQQDADLFASWGVDMLKLDGCYNDYHEFDVGYPKMGKALNASGRPILYSCSWPAYIVFQGKVPDYKLISSVCNIWRNYYDVQDDWGSVKGIINWYGDNQHLMQQVQGPGSFNDPDMLIIGDYALSYDQVKSQFGMWCMFSAPLFISSDLRILDPKMKEVVQNSDIIAIDQDADGVMAHRAYKDGTLQVFVKPLSTSNHIGNYAVAFLSYFEFGNPQTYSSTPHKLGLEDGIYSFKDLYSQTALPGYYGMNTTFSVVVNPSGIVVLGAKKLK